MPEATRPRPQRFWASASRPCTTGSTVARESRWASRTERPRFGVEVPGGFSRERRGKMGLRGKLVLTLFALLCSAILAVSVVSLDRTLRVMAEGLITSGDRISKEI